ncbi:hypothetical protein AXX17_AT5G41970 [Arabidopsis thaliana]|uniref:Transmembrane protein n=1 Tax=Arabidopsis thaliana TaxID=3702 RepID=A0A178ULR2_ARATH|nr:hypothetical protein AXX17_AT5G41970 [Arabidopsis thaliana]
MFIFLLLYLSVTVTFLYCVNQNSGDKVCTFRRRMQIPADWSLSLCFFAVFVS